MKLAFFLLLLAATLSGWPDGAHASRGHATVTLHDAQVTLRRKGDQIEITTTTAQSRALQVPAVAGLSLWTIFGGLSLIGGLLLTGWHFRTGLTLALGGLEIGVRSNVVTVSTWSRKRGLLSIYSADGGACHRHFRNVDALRPRYFTGEETVTTFAPSFRP